jgi:hypothetical protein
LVTLVVVDDVNALCTLIGNSKDGGRKCTVHSKTKAENCFAEVHVGGKRCCITLTLMLRGIALNRKLKRVETTSRLVVVETVERMRHP